MTFEKIGVESHVFGLLRGPDGSWSLRARFRVLGDLSRPRFEDGDWLDVRVVARVYDREEVQKSGVPTAPLAEGIEADARARTTESVIDLPLPAVPKAEYAVVAKVYSADDRYRRPFDPSNCFVAALTFGFEARIRLADLKAIYSGGIGNPIVEAEIRKQVRGGGLIAVDQDGTVYRAAEQAGALKLDPWRA